MGASGSLRAGVALLAASVVGGCRDLQSVLAPASDEAARIADMSVLLLVGGTAVFVVMLVLGALAIFGPGRARAGLGSTQAVVLGGIAFPIVTLSALLLYSLTAMSGPRAPDDPLLIDVRGEQWWWRVTYRGSGPATETANEIHVPVGRPVELTLSTIDVIHSFWVPQLAPKVDMIPGRANRLRFTARRAGTYRGQCAEYCGGPHALMAFRVVAVPPETFDQWFARERAAAVAPGDEAVRRGADVFIAQGCGACHTVRGIAARGVVGPDLTHVASRARIGAEVLETSAGNFAGWIVDGQELKPGNHMPAYASLPAAELAPLVAYLTSLE